MSATSCECISVIVQYKGVFISNVNGVINPSFDMPKIVAPLNRVPKIAGPP